MKDNIKLSDHFSYKRLIRFTIPSIVMLVFTSVYGVVDGLFVSNFVGKTSFAAVNLIMPVLMILGCIGFMFGTGGGALIAMKLGEGKADKANEIFSLIITVSAVSGVTLAGAAIATSISQFVGGVIPLIYFAKKNTSLLKLCKFKFDLGVLAKTCSNGVSEFMSNVSASIVGILYNMQLMKNAEENGIPDNCGTYITGVLWT